MRLSSDPVVNSTPYDGETFNIHDTRRAPTRVYNFVLTSGTCTFVLEGRIGDGPGTSPQTWVQLDTGTASKSGAIPAYPQMRMTFTACSAMISHTDLDADGRKATYSADRTDS